MKKIICFVFVAFIGLLNVTAQDVYLNQSNLNAYVEDLSIKLKTLQHDYDLLYCRFELERCENELVKLENSLKIATNTLQMDCYHGRFEIELYNLYIANYNASVELFDTLKEGVDKTRAAVKLKLDSSNFTDVETKLLLHKSSILDNCIDRVKISLDYYKFVADYYKGLK